jgi:hypothetical protein
MMIGSLSTAVTGYQRPRYVSGRGRPTILWSAIDCEYTDLTQEETEETEEFWEEPT